MSLAVAVKRFVGRNVAQKIRKKYRNDSKHWATNVFRAARSPVLYLEGVHVTVKRIAASYRNFGSGSFAISLRSSRGGRRFITGREINKSLLDDDRDESLWHTGGFPEHKATSLHTRWNLELNDDCSLRNRRKEGRKPLRRNFFSPRPSEFNPFRSVSNQWRNRFSQSPEKIAYLCTRVTIHDVFPRKETSKLRTIVHVDAEKLLTFEILFATIRYRWA